jgi:hypothetical protein
MVLSLYRKDTNLVLKYSIFIEKLQKIIKQNKYIVFMHTTKSLKYKKKSYRIFIQQKFKKYMF